MTDTPIFAPDTGAVRKLLHVGCGMPNPARLPACFRRPGWREVRLDIDQQVKPDIVGNITDLSMIHDARVDAIWSSHNLEHLHSFEVPTALAEFRRVLRPDGFALITLPDLRAIAHHIAEGKLAEPLYQSPAGPISALDVVYGHQASVKAGNAFMAHRTGFTSDTLGNALVDAGFAEVRVHEGKYWDLWAIAAMPDTDPAVYDELASVMQ